MTANQALYPIEIMARVMGAARSALLCLVGQKAELVLQALNMAVTHRKPHDGTHHSSQGSRDTSVAFGL